MRFPFCIFVFLNIFSLSVYAHGAELDCGEHLRVGHAYFIHASKRISDLETFDISVLRASNKRSYIFQTPEKSKLKRVSAIDKEKAHNWHNQYLTSVDAAAAALTASRVIESVNTFKDFQNTGGTGLIYRDAVNSGFYMIVHKLPNLRTPNIETKFGFFEDPAARQRLNQMLEAGIPIILTGYSHNPSAEILDLSKPVQRAITRMTHRTSAKRGFFFTADADLETIDWPLR